MAGFQGVVTSGYQHIMRSTGVKQIGQSCHYVGSGGRSWGDCGQFRYIWRLFASQAVDRDSYLSHYHTLIDNFLAFLAGMFKMPGQHSANDEKSAPACCSEKDETRMDKV